jgi:ATP phosphoribosyltransferase
VPGEQQVLFPRTAIVPAAGLGTRFLPATKTIPKELLPVVDTPGIELVAEEAAEAGAERLVIVTSEGKDGVVAHFVEDLVLEGTLEARGKKAMLAKVRRAPDLIKVESVIQAEPLGFGHANVVVAVPQAWIDVRTMADLEDVAAAFHARRGQRMRVATKYVNLTRRYFAEKGVTDYRIVESLGATEGAPAAGQAELIVDITTTGATLQANALKVLDDGVMLCSQANLVASVGANWSTEALRLARLILSRIAAEEDARTSRQVRARIAGDVGETARLAGETFGARALLGADGPGLELVCPADQVAPLADWLIARGAEHVAVSSLDYVFSARNPLYEKLAARIG